MVVLPVFFLAANANAQVSDFTVFQGKTIASVRVRSTAAALASPEEQLLDIIGINRGEAFSAEKIRSAIQKLYSTGRASGASASARITDDGVALVFTFTPQVKVAAVAFSGTLNFPPDVLLARISSLDRGVRLTERGLQSAKRDLAAFYRENGYYRATIEPSVALDATGTSGAVTLIITPGEPAVIREFKVSIAASALSADELIAQTVSKPGEVFSFPALQRDAGAIRDLFFSHGYLDARFADPVVQYDDSANKVSVRLSGVAGPAVQVTVSGFDLTAKKQRELLPILTEGGLEDFVLEDGRQKLYDYVQRQGYFFADVSYTIKRPDPSHAGVEYNVGRNQRYRIKEILLQGTTHLAIDDIRNDLRSAVAAPFRRGLTSREYLQRDSQFIVRKLAEQGYRHAAVRERRLGFRTGTEDLVITYVVDEGPLTRIGEIEITGNSRFATPELEKLLVVKNGDAFSQLLINKGTENITAKYGSEGFVGMSASVEARETQPGLVALTYNIHEGPRVLINRTLIRGNRITRQSAIARYLSFRSGELLKLEDINRGEQDLYSTGAFKEVKISTESIGSTPSGDAATEKHDVTVSVEEAKSRQIVYGFGYQSGDGPRGTFEISSVNWMGTLTTLSFKTRDSRRDQLAQLSWLNPRPAHIRAPLLLSVLYERQNEVSFNTTRLTGLAQLERRFGTDTLLFLRYNFEKVDIFDVTSSRDLFFNSDNVKLGRLSATFIHDSRNNVFDANAGSFSSLDASVTARWLLGNAQFYRFFGEHQRYFKIPGAKNLVYAADVRAGVAVPHGAATTLPISERFFAGGATTLRGFAFQQAGPRDKLTIPATGQVIIDPATGRPKTGPVGGNALFVLNNELRFPILSALGGVFFSDTGNVFKTVSAIKLNQMSQTLGIGVRVRTPLGPLRLDFGYLLTTPPPGFSRSHLHFSFGQAF